MDSKERASTLEHFRREPANAIGLSLQYKGYHWNVAGPQFHDLHAMFDDHAKMVFDSIDELAERRRILGAPAEYTLVSLRGASNLLADGRIPHLPREMVGNLVASHRIVIHDLKKGFEVADRSGDPGSADLFARIVQRHEKMEWFLREFLERPMLVAEMIGPRPVISKGRKVSLPAGR